MKGQIYHYETSDSGRIKLHVSVSSETKTIQIIGSRNSTSSIPIKVYLRSSLWSLSNEVFFTAWTSLWTTGLPEKSII